jgi:hypothetical protein
VRLADRTHVAVAGSGTTIPELLEVAVEVGAELARGGAVVVCGGLGGTMEGACRGAREAGGTTIGILPGTDRRAANPYVDIAVPTGLGEARNGLIVHCADALIAISGGFGTLSEIALALKAGKPVVGLGTWAVADTRLDEPDYFDDLEDPREAARWAIEAAAAAR